MAKKNKRTLRKKLIKAIIKSASDEIDESYLIRMAKESDEELVDELIHILEWYVDEHNN